jgi:hypothetical protein
MLSAYPGPHKAVRRTGDCSPKDVSMLRNPARGASRKPDAVLIAAMLSVRS